MDRSVAAAAAADALYANVYSSYKRSRAYV